MASTSSNRGCRPPTPSPPSPPLSPPWKRKRQQDEGFHLQPQDLQILSNLSSLHAFINNLVESPDQNPQANVLLKIFSLHRPNSFSLGLLHLLDLRPQQNVRTQIVTLLHRTLTVSNVRRIRADILHKLKPILLRSLQIEDSLPIIPLLCETITNVASRVYELPTEEWIEFLEYIFRCINDNSDEFRQEMGFKLFSGLPDKCDIHSQFWQTKYFSLRNKIMTLFESNQRFQALAFDASVNFVSITKDFFWLGNGLLPKMLHLINQYVQDNNLVKWLKLFAGLAELDVHGEFFSGHVPSVFQCMLEIAKTTSKDDVKCGAIIIVKNIQGVARRELNNFLSKLPYINAKSIFLVGWLMMLNVEDTEGWLIRAPLVTYKSLFDTLSESPSFFLGKFLLDLIFREGNETVVVRLAKEMISTHINDGLDWKKRHAAMLTLNAITQRHQQDLVGHVEKLLLKSIKDPHPAVVCAATEAIMLIIVNQEEPPLIEYDKLLPEFLKILQNPRIKMYPRCKESVVVTISYITKLYGFDRPEALLDDIIFMLLGLLKLNDWPEVQDEALRTLTSFVTLSPSHFCKYNEEMMKSTNEIWDGGKCFICARYLMFMSKVLSGIKAEKFQDKYAIQFMEYLKSIEEKLSIGDPHYKINVLILKALDNICQHQGPHMYKILDKFMPCLLQAVYHSYEFHMYSVQILAINILSDCAALSGETFHHWIIKVFKAFVYSLNCPDFETRMASVSAMPNLLISAKAVQNGQLSERDVAGFTVASLVEALHREAEVDVCIEILKSLIRCIQLSSPVFDNSLVEQISNEICDKLRELPEMTRSSEEPEDIFKGVYDSIKELLDSFGDRYRPHLENLIKVVSKLWTSSPQDKRETHGQFLTWIMKFKMQHGIPPARFLS